MDLRSGEKHAVVLFVPAFDSGFFKEQHRTLLMWNSRNSSSWCDIFQENSLNICHDANIFNKTEVFPLPTRWCVCEGCGVMSQLLPSAMSTVQPAAEAHQHQPRCHAQSGDEGRLPDDTGDLLWYAEVTAFLYSCWCLACWDSWKKSMVCGKNDLLHIGLHFSPVKTKRYILPTVRWKD